MLQARTLTVGFSDSEDRLWLRLGTDHEGAVQLWLTRRVLAQMLPQIWELLGRTLELQDPFVARDGRPGTASQAKIGAADSGGEFDADHRRQQLRRRQLWIEHELAMESSPPLDDEAARDQHPAAMQASPRLEGLLSRVHVSADERNVRFQFDGPSRSLQFSGARADAHRVLHMIWHVQTNAAWGLQAPWESDAAECL